MAFRFRLETIDGRPEEPAQLTVGVSDSTPAAKCFALPDLGGIGSQLISTTLSLRATGELSRVEVLGRDLGPL